MTNIEHPTEIWKPVVGYERFYLISSLGNLKSIARNAISPINGKKYFVKECLRKYAINPQTGYYTTSLAFNGKTLTVNIHRLVALTFIPNPENKKEVNHKDGNKLNNHVTNLEWATTRENSIHAWANGLTKHSDNQVGEGHGMHKLNNEIVYAIRKEYNDTKVSHYKLAQKYNVTRPTISNIIRKATWKHI